MPQLYNNTIAVTKAELISNGVMSVGWYAKNSKDLKPLRAAAASQPALYSYHDLPASIKEKYKQLIGDPEALTPEASEAAPVNPLGYDIVLDAAARQFFNEYRYADTGEGLTEKVKVKYINDASILNAWLARYNSRYATICNCGGSTAKLMQQELDYFRSHAAAIKAQYLNNLPLSDRRLRETIKEYQAGKYASLMRGNERNVNSRKLYGDAAEWLVARYASPVQKLTITQLWMEYNQKAAAMGWKLLKSKSRIKSFLDEPQNRKLWAITRMGELKAKEGISRQHRTEMPLHRDALWYSDGTKLNYYYQYDDANGMVQMGTAIVYEVMDAYSECFIGYAIGSSENYALQYEAYRMAMQISGQKPYEIKYDNQGGHKKLRSQNFLPTLSHLSIATKPYNGKSKTIESAFGRFQSQFLHKDWFFTGQNITATKESSRANMELILANKQQLPTLEEVKEAYRLRREEWNNALHPHSKLSRSVMYHTSQNPRCEKVDLWAMIDLFWLTTDKPIKYRTNGIEIQVNNKTYAYEVLQPNGRPDDLFRNQNVGKRFIVKYDPMDIDTMVHLYEETANGLRYIATAQPYLTIHRAVQDQEKGEMAFIRSREDIERAERMANKELLEDLLTKHGYHPEQHGLVMPGLKGIKAKKEKVYKVAKDDFGEWLKEESITDDDINEGNALVEARKLY